MEILLFLFIILLNSISIWFLYHNYKETQKLHKRIDGIFTVDLPTPNEASKPEENTVELNEQNILPQGVGLEIEGADENIPPGYTPTKN